MTLDKQLGPEEDIRNDQLSVSQQLRVNSLTPEEIALIDEQLLNNVKPHWRKLAMVIAMAMSANELNVSYLYYYERLLKLINEENLETQGNTHFIRWSEVRLASNFRKV